ncbi:unnamed protein product [Callosobruchus maculatus]|uniref:Uncharacterized protein n=1 Tax=Callosobruchus maculatus TaxID=64391 RepID=A0A653CMD6_CALMS|nr:unnamed protein product [Callosobruchus maculatus]
MFANTAAKLAQRVQPAAINTTRNMSVISGPPQVRISFAEKMVHGVAIATGVLAIPAWVLFHIRSYRGLD